MAHLILDPLVPCFEKNHQLNLKTTVLIRSDNINKYAKKL